jgi:hypothetical protein
LIIAWNTCSLTLYNHHDTPVIWYEISRRVRHPTIFLTKQKYTVQCVSVVLWNGV